MASKHKNKYPIPNDWQAFWEQVLESDESDEHIAIALAMLAAGLLQQHADCLIDGIGAHWPARAVAIAQAASVSSEY